jgi:hypothetical protein
VVAQREMWYTAQREIWYLRWRCVAQREMCSSEGYVVAHYADEVAYYGNVVAFRKMW